MAQMLDRLETGQNRAIGKFDGVITQTFMQLPGEFLDALFIGAISRDAAMNRLRHSPSGYDASGNRMKFGLFLISVAACAQPYLDPNLAPERRAADLVSRMTLEEKVLQMQN